MKLVDLELNNLEIQKNNTKFINNNKSVCNLYLDYVNDNNKNVDFENYNLIFKIYFFPEYSDEYIDTDEFKIMQNNITIYTFYGYNLSRQTQIKYEKNVLKKKELHIYFLNLYKNNFLMSKKVEVEKKMIEKNFIQTHEEITHVPVELLIYNLEMNKDFKYYFFNNQSRRNFIKKNYEKNVLDVYDLLIPGTYRGVDLFRLVVLFVLGGVFLDHKCVLMVSLDEIVPEKKLYFLVQDFNKDNIYPNPFIFKKNHIILKNLIDTFCKKVNNKYLVGNDDLEFGPSFFPKYIQVDDISCKITRCENDYTNNNLIINNMNKKILLHTSYHKYYLFNTVSKNEFHYSNMYYNNQIYFNNIKINKNYKFYLWNHTYSDDFDFSVKNNYLYVKRLDKQEGFGFNHRLKIINTLNNKEILVEIGLSAEPLKIIKLFTS